jgi:hypothetical protein
MKTKHFLSRLARCTHRHHNPRLLPLSTTQANKTSLTQVPAILSRFEVNSVLAAIELLDLPLYTNDANDNCPSHLTSYLNTNNCFELIFPWLHDRVFKAAFAANIHQSWGFDTRTRGSINVRVAEYHELRPGGSLSSMRHCDVGSLITVDIMLQESAAGPGSGGGGQFQTVDNRGQVTTMHDFRAGDALVFVSHKLHRVAPVTRGVRKVLVLELWCGPRRTCGHRCDSRRRGFCPDHSKLNC